MKNKQLGNNISRYLLITVLLTIGQTLYGQREYRGKHADFYQGMAFSFLQTFYSLTIDMSQEDELLESYIHSVSNNYLDSDPVFIPDYTELTNKTNILTFKHYISTFKQTYKDYLTVSEEYTDAISLRLSNPQRLSIRYTDDEQGIELNMTFHLEVRSFEKTLFMGMSQAVTVFPDMLDYTDCRIRQISPYMDKKYTTPMKDNTKGRCKEIHKVKRKETVFSISKLYGITEKELIDANPELRQNRMKVGWWLCIPFPK